MSATTLERATRCDRCARVTYGVRVLKIGRLCPRCFDELGDVLKLFMLGAELEA